MVAQVPTPRTRTARSEQTRQRLIQGTIEVIRRDGVRGVTTTSVATAAGLTQPAFYYHFRNVDDCLATVARQLTEPWAEPNREAREQLAQATDFESAVRFGFETAVDSGLSDPVAWQLITRFMHDDTNVVGVRIQQMLEERREHRIAEYRKLAQGLGVKEATERRIVLFETVAWAMVCEAIERLASGEETDREGLFDDMTAITLRILGVRPGGGSR